MDRIKPQISIINELFYAKTILLLKYLDYEIMKKIAVFPLFFLYVALSMDILKAEKANLPKHFDYQWKPLNINGGGFVNFIIIDPEMPNIVYAGVDVGGIYKSIDYGEHWTPFNNGLKWPNDRKTAALTIDPRNGTMYLGTGKLGKNGGIFKRTKMDKSWQLLSRK